MKLHISGIRALLIGSFIACTSLGLIVAVLIGREPCGWLDALLPRSGCVRKLEHWLVTDLVFAPDEDILATMSFDDTVRLWRAGDGTLLRTLASQERPGYELVDIAFSPDGALLALATSGVTELWRVSDGTLFQTLKGQPRHTFTIAFSPDGDTLAEGASSGTIWLWRVRDGALLRKLKGHTKWITDVAFSPDGAVLASGSGDGTVRLWRVGDGKLLYTLEGHTWEVDSVAFAPDGRTLASAGLDRTVRLWRTIQRTTGCCSLAGGA
jgi:WD40 repeat protein